MKTTGLILLASSVICFADLTSMGFISDGDRARDAAAEAQRKNDLLNARVVDPFRIIDGHTNVVGAGWARFSGKVVGVHPDGIRVDGWYQAMPADNKEYFGEFFIANFPYKLAEDDRVDSETRYLYAHEAGTYTYPTAIGGSRTLRKLDYGKVYTPPPPSPESIAAAKAAAKVKADATKKSAAAAALQANQSAADKGDAYGLLRMGERYRDGEGVAQDLPKAREYFAKAVAAGSPTAQNALDKLGK